jgi:hypothetical protein
MVHPLAYSAVVCPYPLESTGTSWHPFAATADGIPEVMLSPVIARVAATAAVALFRELAISNLLPASYIHVYGLKCASLNLNFQWAFRPLRKGINKPQETGRRRRLVARILELIAFGCVVARSCSGAHKAVSQRRDTELAAAAGDDYQWLQGNPGSRW